MKRASKLLKNALLWIIDPTNFFILAVSVSALTYLLVTKNHFGNTFFGQNVDFFMDFFNSVRDASDPSITYTQRLVCYPPMANLIFLIFSKLMPEEYITLEHGLRHNWVQYPQLLFFVAATVAVCAVVIFFTIHSSTKKGSYIGRGVFAFAVFFSMPLLYIVERGNILILCLISMMVYAFTYNSTSRVRRELGLIFFAFAFSLKLYTAVFGYFLIADKRFKDALRAAIYGILMLLLPSFAFGGPSSLLQLYKNVFHFSSPAGGGNLIFMQTMEYLGFPKSANNIVTVLAFIWVGVLALCFIVSPYVRKDEPHKTWILGFVTILCVPPLTRVYNCAFLIIPLIIICNKLTDFKKSDRFFALAISLLFIYIPIYISVYVTPSNLLMYCIMIPLSVFSAADTVIDLVKFIRLQKKNGVKLKEYLKSLIKAS